MQGTRGQAFFHAESVVQPRAPEAFTLGYRSRLAHPAGFGYHEAMATNPLPEILRLSVSERIQLVEDIWDSIAAESEGLPLTDEQQAELDRRLTDAEANPGVGTPWNEVKARLLGTR